jgi:hypothetical protein
VARELVSTPVLYCTVLACLDWSRTGALDQHTVSQQLMHVLFVENCTVQAIPGYFFWVCVCVCVCGGAFDVLGHLLWWEVVGSTLLPPSAMMCCDMLCAAHGALVIYSGTTSGCVDLCRIELCA